MTKFRCILGFLALVGIADAWAQEPQLEKTNPPSGAPAVPAATPGTSSAPAPSEGAVPPPTNTPAATPAPAAPVPLMPPPAEPPPQQNPIGLLILAVILAHVCLPLSLIAGIIILLIIVRLFKGGLTKLAMGLAAGGGLKALKQLLLFIGCLIVLPAGLLGLNWAVKWMDYRLEDSTWWIYGLVVSVLTGLVFFALMKAIARVLKKQLMGRMGGMAGMMGGMRGGGGGFPGGFGGGFGDLLGGGGDSPKDRRKKRR
jgi:hypothetical protein